MILVDTSVWIDHLRKGHSGLVSVLNSEQSNQVVTHPFVIGELACGHLKPRANILSRLQNLTQLAVVAEPEVLHFIEQKKLMGKGIGYIDIHLLAAVALSPPTRLWTLDARLHAIAKEWQLTYERITH